MNSKDPIYWLRDYTDNELDNAVDKARSEMFRVSAMRKEHPDDLRLKYEYYHRKRWFLALVDETANRWKMFDASQRKMFVKQ